MEPAEQDCRSSTAGPIANAGAAVQIIPFRARQAPSPRTTDAPCLDCRVRGNCVPALLPEGGVHLLAGTAFGRRRLLQGQAAYLEGEQFRFVYALRHGSLKATKTLRDGREQVTRFILPGDLAGLDGLAGGFYATSVTALEDSEVCLLPVKTLQEMAQKGVRGQNDMLCQIMSGEIVRDYRHMQILYCGGTEGRLAMFLHELSEGMRRRGYSPTEFHLRMSRAEIGSYIGLTLETVSRTMSAFQRMGVLEVHKRHIVIRSLDALRAICEREGA